MRQVQYCKRKLQCYNKQINKPINLKKMAKNSMMVITSKWNEKETIKMIPISKDCPYNECIYDTENKVLAIISKDAKEKPAMMPKLDTNGRPKIIKGKNAEGELVQAQATERMVFPAFYEYYIETVVDIKSIVDHFAVNPDHDALSVMIQLEHKKVQPKKKPAAKKKAAK